MSFGLQNLLLASVFREQVYKIIGINKTSAHKSTVFSSLQYSFKILFQSIKRQHAI